MKTNQEIELRSNYSHFLPIEVRWGDCDLLGHINNVKFVRYIESGRVAYCKDVNNFDFKIGIKQGWILADLQCSYLGQLHYPSKIEVATRVSKIGNKSMDITASIFKENQEKPIFVSKAVTVWFDYENQKTLQIPDEIRDEVLAFEKSSF